MSEHSTPESIARREFLARAGGGIGSLALLSLLSGEGLLAQTSTVKRLGDINPLAP